MASAPRQAAGAVSGRERQDLVQARHPVLGRTGYTARARPSAVADRSLDCHQYRMLHHRLAHAAWAEPRTAGGAQHARSLTRRCASEIAEAFQRPPTSHPSTRRVWAPAWVSKISDSQKVHITNVFGCRTQCEFRFAWEHQHHYLGRVHCGNLRSRGAVACSHRTRVAWNKFHAHRRALLTKHVFLKTDLKIFPGGGFLCRVTWVVNPAIHRKATSIYLHSLTSFSGYETHCWLQAH